MKDRVLGMRLLKSQIFSAELTAGVYRVEVSTPDNFGSYLLTVGDKPLIQVTLILCLIFEQFRISLSSHYGRCLNQVTFIILSGSLFY